MKIKYIRKILAVVLTGVLLTSNANHLLVQAEDANTNVTENVEVQEEEILENTEEQEEIISEHADTQQNAISNEEVEESVSDAEIMGDDKAAANAESDFEWDGTIITKYKGTSQYVVIPAKATQIASGAFSFKDIVSLSFAGDKVSSIGSSAFYNCKSLKNVTLPSNLKKIETSAFVDCTALEKIIIPQSVHTLGGRAFDGCNSLNSVEIKGNVQSAGWYIFNGCLSLETVKLSENQTTIPSGMFYGATYITNIMIPNTVTEIGSYAFYDCNLLTNITISLNAVKIGNDAFYNCNSLTSIKIPSSVKKIESYAFQNCASLKDVSIAEGVKTIGSSAFYNCQTLKEIVLPESLEEVGYGAFQNCISLEKVTVKSSDVTLRSSIFSNDLVVKLYGLTGSTAEKYAKESNIPFVSIGYISEPLSYVGIYLWQYENGLIEGGAVVNEGVDTSRLSYRWLVYDVKNQQWIQASNWSADYGIHYRPNVSGDYLVYCEVKDSTGKVINTAVGVNYRHAIKETCQMPDPSGNGYLIGIQSFDNQGYYYEMQILDCNLYVQGKDAWIYTTGKCRAQDTTLWTTWQPVTGYYWTLFNLYDSSGKLIDQQCYGFTNAQ